MRRGFFIQFALRVGVRNAHDLFRDVCRFLASISPFMLEQTHASQQPKHDFQSNIVFTKLYSKRGSEENAFLWVF